MVTIKRKGPKKFESAKIVIALVSNGFSIDYAINGKDRLPICRDYNSGIKNMEKAIAKIVRTMSALG